MTIMQATRANETPQLPEGITNLHLRHAILRVQRWARNRRNGGKVGVPRHIHEKAQIVKRFIENQQGTPV
jgi:hypothetical protein